MSVLFIINIFNKNIDNPSSPEELFFLRFNKLDISHVRIELADPSDAPLCNIYENSPLYAKIFQ